jgi:hypothetical protein
MSDTELKAAGKMIEEHEHEIRTAWKRHFCG